MKTPDRSGWSQRTQRGIAASTRAGFEMRNATQRGSIDSPSAKPSRSATAPGARRSAAQQRAELVLDDPARQVLVGQPLAVRPARIGGRREGGQDVVVEEVGERPVARRRGAGRPSAASRRPGPPRGAGRRRIGECRPQARVERPRPEAGLVHDPEAVGEPRVLGRREDPAGALQLADAAQPLEPRGVEQVLLGDVLGGQPGGRRLVRRQPLGQLDVPVDRVADEVDRGERLAAHARSGHPDPHLGGPRADVAPPGRWPARAGRTSVPDASFTVRDVRRGPRSRLVAHEPAVDPRPGHRKSPSPAVCVWSGGSAPLHRQATVAAVATSPPIMAARAAGEVGRLGEDDRRERSGRCSSGRRGRRRRSCSASSSSAPSAPGWPSRG